MSKRDREGYFLVAGLDFGTSFAKVIVQSHGRDKGVAHALECQGMTLIPAVIGLGDGMLWGPLCRPLPEPLPYVKMIALQRLSGLGADMQDHLLIPPRLKSMFDHHGTPWVLDAILAWFFANIIAATRESIRRNTEWADFDFAVTGSDDFWTWQVCVPITRNSNAEISACYLRALKTGYLLADQLDGSMCQKIPFTDVLAFAQAVADGGWLESLEPHCFAFAEVAAGIQAVMRESTTKDGLYMTVDVGAGTVDMNIFRRFTGQNHHRPADTEQDPNNLDYYATSVSLLGAARVREWSSQNPFDGLGIELPDGLTHWGLNPLPEDSVMEQLGEEIWRLFHRAQQYQPNLGCQAGRQTYSGINIHAWGGGLHRRGYSETVLGKIQELLRSDRPVIKRLPTPRGLKLSPTIGFDRLAIAYGLSFPRTDLQKVRLPEDLEPWKGIMQRAQQETNDTDLKFPADYWTNPRYDTF